MRRWFSVPLVLLVLGGVWWWLTRAQVRDAGPGGEPRAELREDRSRESRAAARLLEAWSSLPASTARGPLSIRGRVLGPEGPVPGAWVVAVKPGLLLTGRILSPCGCHDGGGRMEAECSCESNPERLESWLDTYREDTPPRARATTDAEGRFSLEGLEEGAFHLWAEGGPGVVVRPEVLAGTDGVELRLVGAALDVTVFDEDAAPVAGASLSALCLDHGRLFEALTEEGGRWRFDPLPPGEYHVLVRKEGWHPELARVRTSGERSLAVTLHRARRLTGRVVDGESPVRGARVVLAGEHLQREAETDDQGRFAFDGLRPEAYEVLAFHAEREAAGGLWLPSGRDARELVLDLSRPSQMRGVVRDEQGRPLPEAVLKVTERPGPRLERRKLVTLAGADGAYRLGPLADGEYAVRALLEGFIPQDQRWRPGAGPLDFTLRRALLVEGDVVDPEGRPVEDALLRVLDTSRAEPRQVGLARTREDGTFQVEVARAGDFLLAAYHRDFLMAKQEVAVPRRAVRLVLAVGARLSGEVVDSRGLPVAGARVLASPEGGGDAAALAHVDTTDEEGRFSLRGMPAGRYGVEARLDEPQGSRGVESVVELASTASAHLRLVLPEGLPVAGLVVDTEGTPLSDVILVFHPPPGMPIIGFQPTATTGPDGRFRQRHLAPGEYEVDAVVAGYRPATSAPGSPRGRRERFRVKAGTEDVKWVLRREAEVRGRVTREDGSPVTRFRVDGRDVEDAQGRFSWWLFGRDALRLTLSAPDLASTRVTVPARAHDGDVDLGVVVMRAGVVVRGQVLDAATGAPVEGALVDAGDEPADDDRQTFRSTELGAVKSAADGRFTLRVPGEGRRTLVIIHPGHVQKRVALAPGQTQVQVALDAGARVLGRVRASDVYVRCHARLQAEDGTSQHQVDFPCTDFELRGVPAGAYVASLDVQPRPEPQATFPPRRVQVPARGMVSVEFEERREGAALRVRSPGDAQPGDGWVLVPGELEPPADPEALTRATRLSHAPDYSRDGFWTFPHLPAGTYTLFLIRYWQGAGDETWFHREVLQLPAAGEVTREVAPRWRVLARGDPGG